MEYKKKIIISSFGINTGGGLILLNELLRNNYYIKKILIDERLKKNKIKKVQKIYVKKNYLSRIIIFIREILNCSKQDTLICFNNIPPLIRPKCKSILFLQNAFYISETNLSLSFFKKFKIYILRKIFITFLKNVDEIYVQNLYLKKIFFKKIKDKNLSKKIKIHQILLVPEVIAKKIINRKRKLLSKNINKNFFYPASYDLHKNHLNLFKAFKSLSDKNIRLYITLNKKDFLSLKNTLNLNSSNLKKIINLGEVPYKKMRKYYRSCNLIFPSFLESSGLPLYEAYAYGSPIFASKKKFVTDNFRNIITFEPNNYRSIKNAVQLGLKNNLNNVALKLNNKFIYSGKKFLKQLI